MQEDFATPESHDEEKSSTTALVVEARKEAGIGAVVDVSKFSKLQRLVTVTAWVKRFIHNLKAKTRNRTQHKGNLQAGELNRAEVTWVKSAQ